MQAERWKKIEELYQAAIALSAEKRADHLAQACPDDPDLRAEVLSLLAQNADSFLESAPLSAIKALVSGAKLGNFEILELIGRGGMGEVYRARDSRLKRDVAIKVLPAGLARDPDRISRLEREARAAGGLNHPNIVAVYDIGCEGDTYWIATELVAGESLAKVIERGPLTVPKTIEIATQIADGLAAAHAAGIVHRDFKPANIMVTRDGRVKILDFGLALRRRSSQDSTTMDMTDEGTVLGTAGYMSPEQVRGETVDHRSDLFSFGVILYEMLGGKRAFAGGSQVEVMNSILKEEPGELPASVPQRVDRIVRRCVQKDRERRWQSAADLGFALGAMLELPAAATRAPSSASWRTWAHISRFWQAVAGLSILALAVLAIFHFRVAPLEAVPAAEPVRLQIPLPTKPPLRLTGSLALSPNGRQLAFVATSTDGIPRIYLRAMDSLAIRQLPGTESVDTLLFWSPDSRFLAFDSGGKLQKIDISGGPAETICALNKTGVGGSWNKDGVITFGQFGGPIMRVSAAGGAATAVTVLDASHGDIAHTQPYFLPDGRHLMYVRDLGTDAAIAVGSLDAKPDQQDSSKLVQAAFGGAYVPSSDPGFGHMLFMRGTTLLAQPFDARHLQVSGDPVRVLEEPLAGYFDTGTFSVSANGTLAYWSSGTGPSRLTWFDAQGKIVGDVGSPGSYGSLALSPDGTQAIVSMWNSNSTQALWLLDLARGASTRLELNMPDSESAVWAPNGRSIIFASFRAGQMADLYEMPLTGGADAEALVKSNEQKTPLSWSPDGRFLLYVSEGGVTKGDLWLLPLDGHGKPTAFLRTEFDEPQGCFSPDGRWIAYVSNESGRYEVYVRPFAPDALQEGISNIGGKRLISSNGGSGPMWRQDGKELYYIDLEGNLMAVTLTAGPVSQARVPKLLFHARAPSHQMTVGAIAWAPSPDGKRFLFLTSESQSEAPITVVLNWQAGLKK